MLQRCSVAVTFWEYQFPKITLYIYIFIYKYIDIKLYFCLFDYLFPNCNAATRNAKKKIFAIIRRPQSHGRTFAFGKGDELASANLSKTFEKSSLTY